MITPKCPNIKTLELGTRRTKNYRICYVNADRNVPISPWYDIPFFADPEKNILHMVVECRSMTNVKMKISTSDYMNPIKYVLPMSVDARPCEILVYPYPEYLDYPCNYGAIPQTWENPDVADEETGYRGDNDPIDAIEIGSKVQHHGAVIKVKLLACFALINQNAVDWKLIVINVEDPLSEKLNDLKDVERHCSNLLCGIRRWLRVYGVSDGTPQNQLLFDGDPKGCDFALKIAHHCHEQWKELINRDQNENRTGLSLRNSTVQGSPNKNPERNKLIALFQLVWQKFCQNLRRLVRKVLNFCREAF